MFARIHRLTLLNRVTPTMGQLEVDGCAYDQNRVTASAFIVMLPEVSLATFDTNSIAPEDILPPEAIFTLPLLPVALLPEVISILPPAPPFVLVPADADMSAPTAFDFPAEIEMLPEISFASPLTTLILPDSCDDVLVPVLIDKEPLLGLAEVAKEISPLNI